MGDWDPLVLGNIKYQVVGQVWILDASSIIPPLHGLADLLRLTSEFVPISTLNLSRITCSITSFGVTERASSGKCLTHPNIIRLLGYLG